VWSSVELDVEDAFEYIFVKALMQLFLNESRYAQRKALKIIIPSTYCTVVWKREEVIVGKLYMGLMLSMSIAIVKKKPIRLYCSKNWLLNTPFV
jgi:hypothetical protein